MEQVPVGLPAKLDYNLPSSLPPSARSYDYAVSPDGQTSVVAPIPSTMFSANTAPSQTFNSSIISFSPPSGQGPSIYLNTELTTLSFTLTYTVGTASSVTGGEMNLIGSAASFFDTLTSYVGSNQIEQVGQYGLLQALLMNNTVDLGSRNGLVSMGCDPASMTGIELAHSSTGSYRYNFTIPLISVFGVNSVDRLIPIGMMSGVNIQMQTAQTTPITCFATAVTTDCALTTGFTLSEFNLNCKYVDVGDVGAQMMSQTLKNGMWFIKTHSYANSSISIPSGSQGTVQLPLQMRQKSVKSVFTQIGMAHGVAIECPNGYFDAINPSLTSRYLTIAGNAYPQKPLNDSQRPAEGFAHLAAAFGQSLVRLLKCSYNCDQYNSVAGVASIATSADTRLVLTGTGVRAAPQDGDGGSVSTIKFPSAHYHGYDLEKCAGSPIFNGVNTNSANPYVNLNFGVATDQALLMNAWALYDVVLVVDAASKTAYVSA